MGVWAPADFSVPSPTVRPIGRGMGAWASVYDTIGYPIETPGVRLGAAINRAMNQAQVALAAGTPGQTPIMPGDQPGFAGLRGMGVWNRGSFSIPSPVVKIGRGAGAGCGCGCNGAGACGGGMGSLAEYVPDLGETYGINNWVLLAGGAVLAYTLLGRGSNYRQEVREAKDQYRRKVTKAKRTYRRGYRQIYDAVAER